MPVMTKVLVLYTGGTIGMIPSDPANPASPLRPAPKEELVRFVPNPLNGIEWDIEGLVNDKDEPVGPIDSSNAGPDHWEWMARAIEKRYAAYDGFIVLHGTDTMAYTASALSFLLQNLAKPVVVTGSQLPIFQPRTDAIINFTNALHIAGYKAVDLPCVPEVMICFADRLLRGDRTTKVSTSKWTGFDTPNYPHLGSIGEHIVINTNAIRPEPDRQKTAFFIHKKLDRRVMNFALYPGMSIDQLKSVLELKGVRGYVLRTFGAGNAPENPDFLKVLGDAIKKGKVIINVTQCLEGKVEMGLYAASSGLQAVGVISGMDMTAEAALAKLMWLLATEVEEEIPIQAQINQRGEQSENLFDVRYAGKGYASDPLTEAVTISARPSGQFAKERLVRGVVRFAGVGVTGAAKGEAVPFKLYVNLPSADRDTGEGVPQFAGTLTETYTGDGEMTLIRDITPTLVNVAETGRPINLTLVGPEGKGFWFGGTYLNLFTGAE